MVASRDDVNNDEVVFCDPITSAAQNPVCLIKMLLIVGLRFGNVYGTTIQEVLADTERQLHGVLRWKHPKRPLVCYLRHGYRLLDVERSGWYSQVNNLLAKMGRAAGLLKRVTSHAIKKGAVRDAAHLGQAIADTSTERPITIAHHTHRSDMMGVTRKYIGLYQDSVYNLRAAALFKDRLAPKYHEDNASTSFWSDPPDMVQMGYRRTFGRQTPSEGRPSDLSVLDPQLFDV